MLVILLVVCLSSFVSAACGNDKEKKPNNVQIEVYHPQIEGKVVDCRGYYMKYDGNPKIFDVKIYSIQQKRYITNEDLVRKDLNSLIVVTILKNEETNSTRIDVPDANSWPTEIGQYKITVNFNSLL